jgi:putative transposase
MILRIDLRLSDDTRYYFVKRGEDMVRKKYTEEQIIGKLWEAEVLLSKGEAVAVVIRKIGVSDVTYHHRRKEYGGLTIDKSK